MKWLNRTCDSCLSSIQTNWIGSTSCMLLTCLIIYLIILPCSYPLQQLGLRQKTRQQEQQTWMLFDLYFHMFKHWAQSCLYRCIWMGLLSHDKEHVSHIAFLIVLCEYTSHKKDWGWHTLEDKLCTQLWPHSIHNMSWIHFDSTSQETFYPYIA